MPQALNPKCSNSVHKPTKDKFIRICMRCTGCVGVGVCMRVCVDF